MQQRFRACPWQETVVRSFVVRRSTSLWRVDATILIFRFIPSIAKLLNSGHACVINFVQLRAFIFILFFNFVFLEFQNLFTVQNFKQKKKTKKMYNENFRVFLLSVPLQYFSMSLLNLGKKKNFVRLRASIFILFFNFVSLEFQNLFPVQNFEQKKKQKKFIMKTFESFIEFVPLQYFSVSLLN